MVVRSIDKPGDLLVVCGSSGSGKSTLARHVLQIFPDELRYMNTLTTRLPRLGEDSVEYTFVDPATYNQRKLKSERWDESIVYGNYYGLDPDSYIEQLEQGVSFMVCSVPSGDVIKSMVDIYGSFLKTVYIKTLLSVSAERLRQRNITHDMSRIAIDAAMARESFTADFSFETTGDLTIDKENFTQLVGGIIHGS